MFIALFALLVLPSTAVSVNVTVDDTFGSKDGTVIPEYLPANGPWHVGSPTEQCDVCAIKPSELDTSQILDQSWHHGSYLLGTPIYVQVTFPGTAVYVYNVVPNTLPGANTFMNISFAIGGETVGQFSHVRDSSSEIMYNHLVYANATLSDSSHTLVMSASGSNESFIFFDYLLYTTTTTTEVDEPAMPPSPTSHTASPSSTSSPSTTPSSSHPQTAVTITASATVFLGSTTPSPSTTTTSSPSQIQTVTTISAALDTVTVSAGSSTASSAASSSPPPNTGLIAGGVIAGIALLVMVPAIIFSALRHGRRSRRAHPGPYAWPSDAVASTDHWTEYKMTSSSLSLAPSVWGPHGLSAGERSITRTSLAGVGARQGLQDEIMTLRDFAGTMVPGRHTACEEMLPGYDDVDLEQRHS